MTEEHEFQNSSSYISSQTSRSGEEHRGYSGSGLHQRIEGVPHNQVTYSLRPKISVLTLVQLCTNFSTEFWDGGSISQNSSFKNQSQNRLIEYYRQDQVSFQCFHLSLTSIEALRGTKDRSGRLYSY